jgi:ribosomal protein L40E
MPSNVCPRCGATRPDDFRWCRKCGLDFKAPQKSVGSSEAKVAARPSSSASSQGFQLDVRPVNDRANLARYARDVIDVRCLGTVGGLVGALAGFLLLGWIGMAIGGAGVLLAILGIPVGWWVGVRTVLGRMAK